MEPTALKFASNILVVAFVAISSPACTFPADLFDIDLINYFLLDCLVIEVLLVAMIVDKLKAIAWGPHNPKLMIVIILVMLASMHAAVRMFHV